jgi:hypothetical protein
MYPSKVVFEQVKLIDTEITDELVQSCFNEVYSPRHSLEELVAELESRIQSEINSDPEHYLMVDSLYGIKPQKVLLKIEDVENYTLASVISSKGKCLNIIAKIEYEEVHLVGFLDDKYMIANTEINLWSDYAEIIYIPNDEGLTIKKIQLLE